MNKLILFSLLFLGSCISHAQEDESMVEESFIIILSTTNYNAALLTAESAEEKLGFEFPQIEYTPDVELGFIDERICGCGEVHGYFPRGRYDGGKYISIEYSSAYEGFQEGYYIVIVASGKKTDLKKVLPSVKKSYDQAYMKATEVYMGCMH